MNSGGPAGGRRVSRGDGGAAALRQAPEAQLRRPLGRSGGGAAPQPGPAVLSPSISPARPRWGRPLSRALRRAGPGCPRRCAGCGRAGPGLWLTAPSALPAARGLGRGAAAEAGGSDPPGEEGLPHQHVSGGRRDAPPADPGHCGPAAAWSKRCKRATVARIHGTLPLQVPNAPKLVKNAGFVPMAGVGGVERVIQRHFALANARERHCPDVSASVPRAGSLGTLGNRIGGRSISHVRVHRAHTLAFCMLHRCLITKLERCESNTFFPTPERQK